METFAPLVESAAWWLAVDAGLRIFWSGAAAAIVLVAFGAAAFVIERVTRPDRRTPAGE